jgi:hypothetical protein
MSNVLSVAKKQQVIALSNKEKVKAKPANANEVTTGFGVESRSLEVENPKRIRSASACSL